MTPPLISAALQLMPPGGPAVDFGADVGFWSVPLAEQGHVFAYEPVPSNTERLRDNAALNGVQATDGGAATRDLEHAGRALPLAS